MNILMVHPHDLFDKSEPWTVRIKNIAKLIIKKGHRVKLGYFPLLINSKHKIKQIDGIEFIPLNRAPTPKAFICNILKLIKVAKWADVIHLQKCHHYSCLPTFIAAYVNQKPIHYDWDDWEEMIWYESCGKDIHSKFIGFSFKVLERFLPVLSDSVSVASSYLKNLAKNYGVKDENIFDAPVGADLDKFNPNNVDSQKIKRKYSINTPLVLYIGQLHGAQYADIFIKAANIVSHQRPEVTFMIIGEGFWEPRLKKLAYELGLEKKIIFTGAVDHNEVPSYIAAADICVAAFKDNYVTRCKSPLKIVEYLAMGKAIVASNVGEVRNMLGGCGILVESGSHRSLAEGILRLLNDEQLRKRISVYARKRVSMKYNWEYTVNSLLSAYEKIL